MTKNDNLLDMFDDFKKNQEIRKMDEENKALKKKVKKEPKKKVSEEIKTINGLKKQVKLFGKTIPISKLQEAYNWIILNREDLITALDHYFRTYMNPERAPAKEGGITDRRNKRMKKIFDKLQEF